MRERDLAHELDEILNQNKRKNFSVNISSNYKALGISSDLLEVLPDMLLEDMIHFNKNECKKFVIRLCSSGVFEKVILGYKTLCGLPLVVNALTVEEVLAILPVNNDFLLNLYFSHIIHSFLKVNRQKYSLIDTLMSSNSEIILRKTYNVVKMTSTQSDDIFEYTNTIMKNMENRLSLLENSYVESNDAVTQSQNNQIDTPSQTKQKLRVL